jgi:Holliday junction resolvase|tara:strand:+ start:1292 stop:1558 length:267 start_codon:yes stop_codon:yes gene_type:complete
MVKRNYLYQKGVRKERKVVNGAKEMGCIAFRSAGSHSPIDVTIIDIYSKTIRFIQCKSDSMPESAKKRLLAEYPELNTEEFKVSFEVL